ncbi:hypothetical protein SAMN02910292_00701 [Lachnospiraceae bacterium XBB2008]|nr:hypothetical protein SAMN02910292_00701 [Lachnospiraceae bacterium XBB2008]
MDKNHYDEQYDIRLGKSQDIDAIMSFIDTYWSKGHILSKDRKLFEYEFCDDDKVNMVLAIDRKSNSIHGVLGFLWTSHTEDYEKKAIWGSVWKVIDSPEVIPFLGIELAKRVYSLSGARFFIGNGANPKTSIRLRKLFFNSETVKLNHYYLYNQKMTELKLAFIAEPKEQRFLVNRNLSINRLTSIDDVNGFIDLDTTAHIPYKDSWYVDKRFFRHPYYKYFVWGITDSRSQGMIVAREVSHDNAKALRIVDYYGDQKLFADTGYFWSRLIDEQGYEYVDFYEHGFVQDAIFAAGFHSINDGDANIIPNYFEPFVRENVDIWGHFEDSRTLLFKADGDQDRPNQCSDQY